MDARGAHSSMKGMLLLLIRKLMLTTKPMALLRCMGTPFLLNQEEPLAIAILGVSMDTSLTKWGRLSLTYETT